MTAILGVNTFNALQGSYMTAIVAVHTIKTFFKAVIPSWRSIQSMHFHSSHASDHGNYYNKHIFHSSHASDHGNHYNQDFLTWKSWRSSFMEITTSITVINHRRRIETEGKAKIVLSVWGTELFKFLATLAVLSRLFERNG